MEIEEYYYHAKNQKSRKYGIEFKRMQNTLRKRVRTKKGAVDGVAKRIQTSRDWDADRINEFCESVLQDGGLIDTDAISYSKAGYPIHDSEVSLKKGKRWLLCDEIRKAAMLHANDPEMPDVVIVERFGKTGPKRRVKPDIVRATYSVTTPVAQPSKKGPHETRLVVDRCPSPCKSYFCSEATLQDNIKKASSRSDGRAEVTYTFRTSDSLFLNPPDKIKSFCRKMPNARFNKCKQELDAYFNSEGWDDAPYDVDSENDDLDVEMEPRKDLVLNLEDEIAAATSKNKRGSKNRKVQRQATPVEHATTKGKVIKLPISERTGDIGIHEDNSPTRHSIELKMPAETIRQFIARHDIPRSESVSIANAAPASFTVDLRRSQSNNIKEGFCHLLFETDYDPDMFDLTYGDQCNVVVTVCSTADEKIMQAVFGSLTDLLATLPEDEANVSIEQIVSAARITVSESWNRQGSSYHKVEPESVDKKGTRNFHICEDLAERIGARSSIYSNIDNLRHSTKSQESEPDEDYDFEVVPDVTKIAEECRLCHSSFREQECSGMAIRDCRHWFCKKCWSNYLCKSEEFIGKCMEPGCNSSMNAAMKLILCSYKLPQSSKQLNSGRLGDEFAYLCPNSSCGKVVKTMFPVDEPSILTCSCGTAWCGKCGNEPHWPASCEAAEMQSLEYIAMSLKSSNTAARYTKECPQCHKTIERKNVRRYGNVCPNCSHQFHCWKCVGECQDDHLSRMRCSMRYYRWYDRPCKREEVPETKSLSLPGFSPDGSTPAKVYESIFKIMKSLRSYEFENTVRRRASLYFEDGHCDEIMQIITDLLFARNQLCFFIVWITAAMRYGNLNNSSKRKYIQGILKKLESGRDAMDWLLISRDYACNDGAFPEAYVLNVTKANNLLKLVIHAFK